MYSTNRGLFKCFSIGFVVLFGWFALLSTGNGPALERASYASPAQSPGTTIFPSWVISPNIAVLTPRPAPTPVKHTVIIGSNTYSYTETPAQPWDTEYIKASTVLQDNTSKTYRMYYESNTVILSNNYVGGGDPQPLTQFSVGSAIGIATSSDGINWTRPTSDPIFTHGPPGAWDSSYVGSPRVVFDGNIYRMFYVGSSVTGPASGVNRRFTADAPAYVGLAESLDGINFSRNGLTAPVLTTTVGAWDNWYVEPSSARIENGTLKLYYTGGDQNDKVNFRTGLATESNFSSFTGSSVVLTKASGNPVKVNGTSNRIRSAYTSRFDNNLFMWYVNNSSGSDLIYQSYGNDDLNFTRDPDGNVIKPGPKGPNDLLGQVDIGGVQIYGTPDFRRGIMWFSGRSGSNLLFNAYRAEGPDLPVPPPAAVTPLPFPTRTGPTPTPTTTAGGIPALPPPVPEGGPGAFLTATPGEGNYPAFYQLWRRVDEPVRLGFAQRSWLYDGLPYGFRYLRERYEEGSRLVLYHDKARMEATADGGVTNGLLAKELISGLMQVGDNKFEPRNPAVEAVAGDAIELNQTNPAYYSFGKVASLNNDKRVADRSGQVVIETLNRNGDVGADNTTSAFGITYSYYDQTLGHNVASVFWNYFQQRGTVLLGTGFANDQVFDWLSTVGLPLSEPFWTKAVVGGNLKDVLVQAFERRIMTYTPTNLDPFKVEMGNVGRHYFRWRYNQSQ